MSDTTEAALNDLIAVSMNDRMIINHAGIIQDAVEVIRSALAAARTENERLTALLDVTEGIVLDRAAEINVARVALAEANRKWDEMLMDNDPTASLIRDLAATEPEPLPLDPEPWLCAFPLCENLGEHRAAEHVAGGWGVFSPGKRYEQDRARYEGNTLMSDVTKPVPTTGVGLIAAEQERARTLEGYDAEHDRGHARDLIEAAGCYVQEAQSLSMGFPPSRPGRAPGADDDHPGLTNWPWHPDYWKPTGDPVRDLTKAGSLIASAIDSLLLDRREH